MKNYSCEIISSRKLDYYVYDPNAVIIDLRGFNQYRAQHIKNSINIEYDEIIRYVDDYNLFYRKYRLDNNKIYILYCDRGAMSLIICNKMTYLGYKCKSIAGGFNSYKGVYLE